MDLLLTMELVSPFSNSTSTSSSDDDDWKRTVGTLILREIPNCVAYLQLLERAQSPTLILEMLLMNRHLTAVRNIVQELQPFPGACDHCQRSFLEQKHISLTTFQEDHSGMERITRDCLDKLFLMFADKLLNSPVQNIMRIPTTEHHSPPEHAPSKVDWIPDNESDLCMCCKLVRFSSMQRRHHCRRCGRIVCNGCSKWRKRIPESYKDRSVRHCDDCLGFSEKCRGILQETPPLSPQESLIWQLFSDESDSLTREEFFKSHAIPDVEQSLAVMDICENIQDIRQFLCHEWDTFEELIRDPIGRTNGLNLKDLSNVLMCLTMVAKVRDPFATDWDLIMAKVQLMRKLTTLDLEKLIPTEKVTTLDFLRQLRDNLLSAGMFTMAFDSSLLSGLPTLPVLVAWGIQCLKQGNFTLAREKLSSISQRVITNSLADKLAKDVVQGSHFPEDLLATIQRPKVTPSTALEMVKTLEGVQSQSAVIESFYYLFLCGSHRDILVNLITRKFWPIAFRYVLEQAVEFDDFLEAVILSPNEISEFDLVMLMRGVDPGLERWKPYLMKLFILYEKKNILATIYNLQSALGDDLRAALTCIKFFSSNCSNYRGFVDNQHYLENAEFHFKRDMKKKHHLELMTRRGVKQSRKSCKLILDSERIELYLRTISLQKRISRFLASFDQEELLEMTDKKLGIDRPISLFDRQHIRSLVILLVSCDIEKGYELVCDVLSCFASKHRSSEMHEKVLGYFISANERETAIRFIEQAKKRIGHEMDDCILEAVRKEVTSPGESSREILPEIIKCIDNVRLRTTAFLEMGHLKSAYLLAVAIDDDEMIGKIAARAEIDDQPLIKRLCEKRKYKS